ncbi:MAG: hypothetical protein ABL958_19995 [Bdellovibrionia bacterium]
MSNRGYRPFILVILLLAISFGLYSNCSPASNNGEPSSSGGGNGTTIGEPMSVIDGNPYNRPSSNFNMHFCLVGIDVYDPLGNLIPIDLDPEEILMDPGGTRLALFAPFVYYFERVEFRTANQCNLGYSLRVINPNGDFQSVGTPSLKFQGTVDAQGKVNLGMDFQPVINGLNAITNAGGINSVTNTTIGPFSLK